MRALISVSEKEGLEALARGLSALGVQIISTGGTATAIQGYGVPVTILKDVTGFPEILDGRVKTLHPKVHGGLLARRDLPEHMRTIAEHGIELIDILVVNFYPFEKTIAKDGCTLEDAIENIDIGGPAMVRSAAKNWKDVAVITDPSQYPGVLAELGGDNDELSLKTKFTLSCEAFRAVRQYDEAIDVYLTNLTDEQVASAVGTAH